jgi:Right handed beta helix region
MRFRRLHSRWARGAHGRRRRRFLPPLLTALSLLTIAWPAGCGGSATGGNEVVSPPPGVGVVYVSSTGYDLGLGTLVDPLQSIQAAIDAAAVTYTLAWVLVETGLYDVPHDQGQSIVLAEGISLFGGYAAGFGARDPVAYPSNLSDTSTALGTFANPDRAVTAPAGISGLTVLDGLGIFSVGTGYAAALYVDGGSPTVQDCVISATNAGAVNSYGIFVNGGSPRILDNEINGGKGTTSAYGIYSANKASPATAAEPEIRGNRINLQSWVGTGASAYGIWLASATSPSVTYNTLSAGRAQSSAVGIEVFTGNTAVIEHNTIDGGIIVAGTGSKITAAIQVGASGAAPTIRYNDISGGTGGVESHGIKVQNTSVLLYIISNTIAGGDGTTSYGVRIYQGGIPFVSSNTVQGGTGLTSYGIYTTGSTAAPILYANSISAGSLWEHSTAYGVYNSATSASLAVTNNTIFVANWDAGYGIYNSSASPAISGNDIDAEGQPGTGIHNFNSDATLSNNDVYASGTAIDLNNGSNPAISGGNLWAQFCIREEDQTSDPASINGVGVACTVDYRDADIPWDFGGTYCGSGLDGLSHAGNNFCDTADPGDGGGFRTFGLATPVASNIVNGIAPPPWK